MTFQLLPLLAVFGAWAFSQTVSPITEDERRHLLQVKTAAEDRLKSYPEDTQALRQMGFVSQKLGDVEAAESAFKKLTELNPADAGAHYMLALVYEKLGQSEKAIASWKECLKHSKDPKMRSMAQKHIKTLLEQMRSTDPATRDKKN